MPLHIPITIDVAEKVWAYTTRRLTSLAIPTDIVSRLDHATYGLSAIETLVDDLETRLTAARAGYLDLLADPTVGLAALESLVDDLEIRLTAARAVKIDEITATRMSELDSANIPTDTGHIPNIEFGKVQAPATENAAVTIAVITADQSLGSKDITVDVPAGATITSVLAIAQINIMNNSATAQKIDLKFEVESVVLFSQTDVVGFGAVDGAASSYVIAENASDEVTTDGQVVTLEAKATLSAAASVRFQAQYYLIITYKMG